MKFSPKTGFSLLFSTILAFTAESFAAKLPKMLSAEFSCYTNVRTISKNGIDVSSYTIDGMHYINGVPVGKTLKEGFNDEGDYIINGHIIDNYDNGLVNKETFYPNISYLSAYYKFTIQDYKGAIKDSKDALIANKGNRKAKTLRRLSRLALKKNPSSKKALEVVNRKINATYNQSISQDDGNYENPSCIVNGGKNDLTINNIRIQTELINETYYVNGRPVGKKLEMGFKSDGIYYVNDKPLEFFSKKLDSNNIPVNPLYLQAYYQYSFKKFEKALSNCKNAKLKNPSDLEIVQLCKAIKSAINDESNFDEDRNKLILKAKKIHGKKSKK